jgi:hypothetical protein
LVKDENRDLLADSYSVLRRVKNYLCQLLNVHGVNNVRKAETHTAERTALKLVPSKLKLLLES